MKKCTSCEIIKEFSHFHKRAASKDGHALICKECAKRINKEIRERNPEKIKQDKKEYHARVKDGVNARRRALRKANPEKVREKERLYRSANPEVKKKSDKNYYIKNAAKIKEKARIYRHTHKGERNEKERQLRQKNPQARLRIYLRNRLNKAIKGRYKAGSAVADLGCSIDELKLWLENKFNSEWDWEDHGELWEIDHIVPLSNFNLENRQEFLQACHYTNLQPLSKQDHIQKTSSEAALRNNKAKAA